jgi:hypothetical protein
MPTNNLKHVGQIINTQRRCVVVFREIPDDTNNCLVVDTDALPDWMHDDVMNAVQSQAGQDSPEFYTYASRSMFSDGTNMLNKLHTAGLLKKQPASNISMVPNRETSINLAELNTLIREQNGDRPAVTEAVEEAPAAEAPVANAAPTADTMDDAELAKGMLSQADVFEKEAQRLREEAYEMAPSLKPKSKKRGRPAKATASA